MRGNSIFRTLLLLFAFVPALLFAQTKNNYNTQWKKIDSLITKRGLTASALTEVQKIYTAAKKEKNDPQVIKALIYQMGLQQSRDENATEKSIALLEKEIASASEPSKSILQSILAKTYWDYFQNNRWKFYDRTETVNFKKEDIATWDVSDFLKKTSELYTASIKNETILQQTKVQNFDPIIIKGNVRYLRPTLYDLLAHRALDHFKTAANEPKADTSYFASSRLIYSKLKSFHEKAGNTPALIDVTLEEIQYNHNVSTDENKDSLYYSALQKLIARYPNEKEISQAWYLIAETHVEKARKYDPLKDTSNRFEYVVAKNILEKVIASKDSTYGKMNSLRLLNEITAKEMHLQAEKVNIPNQPFRMLVTYKNFTQLKFRLVKFDRKIRENLSNNSWSDELLARCAQDFL